VANYGVNINFKVVGQSRVDRAITSAKKLEKSLSRIRSIDLSKAVPGPKGDRIAEALGQLRGYAQQVNKLGKTIGKTPSQQQAAADSFKEVADNAKVGSFTFEEFTKAAFKQSEGLKASEKAAENVIRRMKGMQTVEQRDAQIQRRAIKLRELRAKKERELAAAENKRRKRQTAGNAASSAIIGGAFPLLFGQTGAAAVGGGLGGAAGGLLGGQFGFALSILGTAIGSAIDKNEKFNQSLAALNVQFSTTSGGTQVLAADVDKLAKRLSITKEEAIATLGAFKEFGSGSIAKSLTEIFGSDAGAFGGIAGASRQSQLANQIFEARQKIGVERAIELQQQNLSNKAGVVELALAEARAQAENDIAVAQAKQIKFSDRAAAFFEEYLLGTGGMDASRYSQGRADKLNKEFEDNRKKRLENFTNALEKYRELLGLTNEAQGQFGQSGVLAFTAINDKVKDLQDEMLKLQNPIFQVLNLSQAMAQSFESSFAGIIKGTMTVQDAFRNMLNKIADFFIANAAKMAANRLQRSLLGMFGKSLFGGDKNKKSIDPFGPINFDPFKAAPGEFVEFSIPKRQKLAGGGMAKAGRTHLVGERGPELFTPGVSGMVTPNHALGGSTNVVVNVDASGTSVQGDEDNSAELGRLVGAAVQAEMIRQQRPGGILAR